MQLKRAVLRRQLWLTIASFVLVFAYILVIQKMVGWSEIYQAIRSIGFLTFFFFIAVVLITQLVRLVRIVDYYQRDIPPSIQSAVCLFRISQVHNLANNLLPFRAGEAALPVLLKDEFGVKLAVASGGLLLFRGLDLAAILLFFLFALGVFYGWPATQVWLPVIAIVVPLVGYRLRLQLRAFIQKRVPKKQQSLLLQVLEGVPDSVFGFVRTWLLTLLNWGIKLCLFAWLLQLVEPMSAVQALAGALGGELSSVLPVHAPGGAGTYSAGVVAGASAVGASVAGATKAGAILHMGVLVGAICSTLIALSAQPFFRR